MIIMFIFIAGFLGHNNNSYTNGGGTYHNITETRSRVNTMQKNE